MPAWGLYPNASPYGNTKPLGSHAAWTAGDSRNAKMTWVANFPQTGEYSMWVRGYGGYTTISVMADELFLFSNQALGGGARYVWKRLGTLFIEKGKHHIDVILHRGMLDGILFAQNPQYDPMKGPLPEPVRDTESRTLRRYRDDSHLIALSGDLGFVVGSVVPYEEVYYDWVPKEEEIIREIKMWGAADQYINGTIAIRALSQPKTMIISLKRLVGPRNLEITSEEIDLRVVHLRRRKIILFEKECSDVFVPELLLRDDRTSLPPKGNQGGFGGGVCITNIPAHESRQIWISVHISKAHVPGIYLGELLFTEEESGKILVALPIELDVLSIDLKKPDGYYAIYYWSQPTDWNKERYVSPERYQAELNDQVRHGLNATSLYAGFSTLKYAREAGMTNKPCLMQWPNGRADDWIAQAIAMGFEGLLFYGVDEPKTEEQIDRCIKEAKRRRAMGLNMLTAINNQKAYEALRDYVDYPVLNTYVFGVKGSPEISYIFNKGFTPISYWGTSTTFPLYYRALTGLYNKACGFSGSMPWSYQDFPDNRLYDVNVTPNKMTYPDKAGQPIPTICWEAHRSGIDDVRYLEAMDRAIAKARDTNIKFEVPKLSQTLRNACDIRRKFFEEIKGRWFEYLCTLRPGQLEESRRAFAKITLQLNEQVQTIFSQENGDCLSSTQENAIILNSFEP